MVKGRRVSGFTNSEEAAVGLTDVVPFLLEGVAVIALAVCFVIIFLT